jgi:hypothetical protein
VGEHDENVIAFVAAVITAAAAARASNAIG